jgi:esterase
MIEPRKQRGDRDFFRFVSPFPLCALCLVVNLVHRDFGGAGRPPLVLLHGLLGSSRNWQTTGVDLATQYHVLALDLRNHGRSPQAELMTYPAMVGDVVHWLDEQGLSSVSFVGHSMGGKVAMLLACRHPERVSRLVVVDIAPKTYVWAGHRASFAAMNELELGDLRSRAEAEMRLETRVPSWATRKFLTTNLERNDDGSWRWVVNLPVLTDALATLEANPLAPEDRFAGPTQFIAGGKSNYIEAEDHPAIRAHFPAATITVLPESGHNPHMESREAFVRTVLTT